MSYDLCQDSSTIDCNHLPESVPDSWGLQQSGFDRGCRGAVDSSGNPGQGYCEGTEYVGDYHTPWYEKCCKWKNERCLPKTQDDGKYAFLYLKLMLY